MTKHFLLIVSAICLVVIVGFGLYWWQQSSVVGQQDNLRLNTVKNQPAPSQRTEYDILHIPWEEAVNILNSGQVELVSQSHDRSVFLYLKDETTLRTQQPNLDDIYLEVEKCGDLCQNIVVETE